MTDPYSPVHPATLIEGGQNVDKSGITVREYFAAMAMQGILSEPSWNENGFDSIAGASCDAADALIEALNRPTK